MAHAPRTLLTRLFHAAVRAADAAACVPQHLPPPPPGRTLVIGAGKAAAAMARAVEDHWPGAVSGLVVTRYGHGVPCERIEVIEAGHPLPDAAGRDAAARMLAVLRGLTSDDLVLVLMSGGGSALLALPWEGITLADKQAVNRALLKSGAGIGEMNCVRKHLSAIKGGRLAIAAYPARVVTLVISDVPGDDPAVVASGPTLADPTTCADALAILEKYRIDVPHNVRAVLESGVSETPKPGDVRFAHCETTVTLRGQGRGGRNAEFLLALALALDGHPGIHALAGDTDGIDGTQDNAGALLGPDTLARAAALGVDAKARLADNDGYGFFAALDDLLVSGPTRTNVNDFRAILIT